MACINVYHITSHHRSVLRHSMRPPTDRPQRHRACGTLCAQPRHVCPHRGVTSNQDHFYSFQTTLAGNPVSATYICLYVFVCRTLIAVVLLMITNGMQPCYDHSTREWACCAVCQSDPTWPYITKVSTLVCMHACMYVVFLMDCGLFWGYLFSCNLLGCNLLSCLLC